MVAISIPVASSDLFHRALAAFDAALLLLEEYFIRRLLVNLDSIFSSGLGEQLYPLLRMRTRGRSARGVRAN